MIIKLTDVQKKYKDFSLNCSLEVEEGTIVALIGQNGAGKSTTFKAILGLIEVDGGDIELFDKPVKELSIKDREDIGVVMSESFFSTFFTIKDIAAVLKATYSKFNMDEFFKKCQHYNLPLDKKLKEFSTGMKAKIKVLSAMSYEARLLILDEPTLGLDAMTRNEILDELREYMEVEGRAIIISSHISSDLEGLCDNFYFIQNGKMILQEETDLLLSEYATLKVSKEQFEKMDKEHLLYKKEDVYGYQVLTKEKQYYIENYKDIVVEKGNIDDLIMLITKGEKV